MALRLRRAPLTEWLVSSTSILEDGQPGYDQTSKELRVGDGVSRWDQLPGFDYLIEKYLGPTFRNRVAELETKAADLFDSLWGKVDRGELVINVLDYGAKGDGTTNDQAAFQAALDVIKAARAGSLLIPGKNPAGTFRKYLINGRLDLPVGCSRVRIVSDGGIFCKTEASPYSYFQGRSYGATGYGSGPSNIYVTGLTFTGSFNPSAFIGTCAFGLHHSQNVVVEGNKFIEMQSNGHVADLGGCDQITFRDNVFAGFEPNGTYHGERAEAIQIDSSYNGATSTSDAAPSFDGSLSRDILVENNYFLPLTNEFGTFPCPNPIGAHSFREGLKYRNIRFINNLVVDPIEQVEVFTQGSNGTGVVKFGTVDDLLVEGNTFVQTTGRPVRAIMVDSRNSGNLASADPNVKPTTTGTFPSGSNRSDTVKIRDNKFIGFTPAAGKTAQPTIYISGVSAVNADAVDAGYVYDVLVDGNTFDGGDLAGTAQGEVAIYCTRTRKVKIVNNDVRNYKGLAYLSNAIDTKIIGNDTDETSGYVIYGSTATGVTMLGNNVRDFSKPTQFDANSRDIAIVGNAFIDPKGADGSGDRAAVNMAGAQRFTITGNVVTDTDATKVSPQAFSLYSGADHGTVAANEVFGYVKDLNVTGTMTNLSAPRDPLEEAFTVSGTWTKAPGAKRVRVLLFPGGGPGGSGRQGAPGTVACGGGGGGGGGYTELEFDAADLPATVPVSVAGIAPGGAAVTTPDTNGNPGTAGGHTYFGSSIDTAYAVAMGGFAGAGGTANSGTNGPAGSGQIAGVAGGSASTTGGVGGNAAAGGGCGAGGGGGGITAADQANNGGTGSGSRSTRFVAPAGGIVGGALPSSGTAPTAKGSPGTGAGGGAAALAAAAQAGANAAGYGAGGGGGGGSRNGNNSGKGGDGAPGYAYIVTTF